TPNAQARIAANGCEGLEQELDPLRGDVGADVAERERLPLATAAPRETLKVEAVVEVGELRRGDAALVTEAAHQVVRRRDEEVHLLRHRADVAHAPRDPSAPVRDIDLELVGRPGEVARVATLRALAVLLAVTRRP